MRHLQLQLSYVYNQIISVLTLTSLNKIFKQRVNYDLRRMLTGTEKFIDNILKVMDNDTSYLLGSVRCLPLNPSIRDTITQTLLQCCKVKVTFLSVLFFLNFLTLFCWCGNCCCIPNMGTRDWTHNQYPNSIVETEDFPLTRG